MCLCQPRTLVSPQLRQWVSQGEAEGRACSRTQQYRQERPRALRGPAPAASGHMPREALALSGLPEETALVG